MKSWKLNNRLTSLSQEIIDPAKTQTKIDYNCFTESEIALLDKVQVYIDKYAPGNPPQDVIEKHADLWHKGLEIFGKHASELFVEVMPASFCCDELEEWYFKLYFYNFMHDWTESIQRLRSMPKEKRQALLLERKEMGLLDKVFRLPRNPPQPANYLKQTRSQQP